MKRWTSLLLTALTLLASACGGDETGGAGPGNNSPANNNPANNNTNNPSNNSPANNNPSNNNPVNNNPGNNNPGNNNPGETCTPGERACFGSAVASCNASGTGYLAPTLCEADEFCRDGACVTQVCAPGETICADGGAYRVCAADGSGYGESMSCGEGSLCRGGSCEAQVCAPGEATCLGSGVALCNADGSGYGAPVSCEAGEFCREGSCEAQVCTPGEASCDGDAVRRCRADGSGLEAPEACGVGLYCEAGRCEAQVCVPGATRCEPGGVSTCDARGAGWGAPEACGAEEACTSGACLPTLCEPGSRVCSGDGVLTCLETGNGYGPPTPCGAGSFCQSGVCEAQVCTPGSRSCDVQGRVVVCSADGSGTSAPEACGAAQYCSEGFCYDQVCAPGATVCEANGVRTCAGDGSGYGAPAACGAEAVCVDGSCVATTCEPNTASCQGASVVVCNAEGTGYSNPVACGAGRYCEAGACQVQACAPNSAVCEGDAVRVCDALGSALGPALACGDGRYCAAGECFDQVCEPNATSCSGSFAYHICNSQGSGYGESFGCGEDRYCDEGSCFDQVCTPSARECVTEQTYHACAADGSGYGAVAACAGGRVCSEGMCLDPSEVPNPAVQVAFVRPQPNAVRELTQGESLSVLVNATAQGATLVGVDLEVDGAVVETDVDLPYEFTFTVAPEAMTGASYTLVARARDSANRFNVSAPATVRVRNDVPVAAFTATVSGDRQVTVDATASSDRETSGAELEVRWSFNNDGQYTAWSTDKVATFTYPEYGEYTIALQVRDGVGQTASRTQGVSFSDITYVGGAVSSSTTWYGTVVVTGDITVPSGVTLTVAEGTQVLFVYQDTQPADGIGDYGLEVQSGGSLVVEGSEASPVIFSVYGDNRAPRSWAGITLQSGMSSLQHAIVEYGEDCLNLRDDATVEDVEVRSCRTGVQVGAAGVTLNRVSSHDNQTFGLRLNSGATGLVSEGLALYGNGGAGAEVTANTSGSFTGCEVFGNAGDGWQITDATPAITRCAIHENGGAGLWYRSRRGGSLSESEVLENGAEGVRLEVDGSGPTINRNNIYGNSVTGGWRVMSADTSSTLRFSGSACCGTRRTSSTWTAPMGGVVRRVYVDYNESDNSTPGSYITGGLLSGATLYATFNRDTAQWVDLGGATPSGVQVWVLDSGWGGTQTITGTQAIYAVPGQSGVEVSANVLNTTVDLRANYLGVFPDVLGAVSMSAPTAVNLQGFTGVAFDEAFDTGPYLSGALANGSALSGTVYITGDLTLAAGASATVAAGTQVLFVKHDQNGDGVGDFRLTLQGSLTAQGTAAERVRFDGYGTPAPDDAFTDINAPGLITWSYVDVAHGLNNLTLGASASQLDHVRLQRAGQVALRLSNTSGAMIRESEITDAGGTGVTMAGGSATLERVQILRSSGHGLHVTGSNANLTLRDSTLRENMDAGLALFGASSVTAEYNHLGDNAVGLLVSGLVSGQVIRSNISFNNQEGVRIHRNASGAPTVRINNNNIFSNAVINALDVGREDTSSTLRFSGSACCGTRRTSSTWTAPMGGAVQAVYVDYNESDNSTPGSYITGGLLSGATLYATFNRDTAQWVDLGEEGPSGVQVWVLDSGWGGTQTVTGTQAIYTYPLPSDGSANVALTAWSWQAGDVYDLQSNWWGGSLNPAGLINEEPVGLINFSSFTGQAYTVGPR